MIFDFFYYIFKIVLAFLDVLPNWELPQNIFNTIGIIVGYTLRFEGIIPIHTIYYAFFVILGFHIALFIIRVFLMIINWIRGAGSIEI